MKKKLPRYPGGLSAIFSRFIFWPTGPPCAGNCKMRVLQAILVHAVGTRPDVPPTLPSGNGERKSGCNMRNHQPTPTDPGVGCAGPPIT